MTTRLRKTVTCEVAHCLPGHPMERNRRMHGHSLSVTVTIEGERAPSTGMLFDLSFFGARVEQIVGLLDHTCLNTDHPEINPPTLETIAEWLGRAFSTLQQPGRVVSVLVERRTCNEAAEWLA